MSDGELMYYAKGQQPVPRHDRQVAANAHRIHDEVRTAAFKADGAVALAGHIAEGVTGLIKHKREICKDDPELDMVLSEVVNSALGTCKGIQSNLYKGWNL